MRRLLLLLITTFTVGRSLAAPLPTALIGSWQVTQVATDTWIESRNYVIPNDPYLVGRRVVISLAEIRSPMSFLANCQSPASDSAPALSLDKLVALTDGDRQSGPVKAVARDYDLAYPGGQQVTPLMLSCKKGSFADQGVNIQPWMALADENTLLVSGNMSSILVLKRIINERPAPAFSCRKAQQEDEKAICASFDLATWDISVNNAYRTVVWQLKQAENKSDLNKVIHAQQAWIKRRSACHADSECLYQSMYDRLVELSDY